MRNFGSSKLPAKSIVDTEAEIPKAESKMLALLFSVLLFNDLDLLGVLFILYSTMEKALKNAIRDADIESSLAVPTFQFQKQRIELLRHLHSDSRRTTGVSTDLIRHMAEAILKQQDERGILTVLEDFEMDERSIKSRMKSFLRSSTEEEELWLAAGKRASSLSDSEFLSFFFFFFFFFSSIYIPVVEGLT